MSQRYRESVSFAKSKDENHYLQGVIDLPSTRKPHAYAIFAHCFTCGKSILTAKRIASALTHSGIAVLRFDFTGIGESDGEFSNSHFSSNVNDIRAAHRFLTENYQTPELLIGHSLGGAAVLEAALHIPDVKAVVAIAAPASPSHVKHLLKDSYSKIETEGVGYFKLGGKSFEINKSFLNDLESVEFLPELKSMKKPLLLLHSPQDEIVEISNAAKIYEAAFHPKSFITLDGADHMVSDKEDARYAGNVIGSWVSRYIVQPDQKPLKTDHMAMAHLSDDGFTTQMKAGRHQFTADEPTDVGGNDFGPSPYELLASALASCTAMTIKMYANHKNIALDDVTVHVSHERKHAEDLQTTDKKARIDFFERSVELNGDLEKKDRERMLEIANKCPVHRTLLNQHTRIETELKD